jgi:hypothetical protein
MAPVTKASLIASGPPLFTSVTVLVFSNPYPTSSEYFAEAATAV